MAQVTCRICKQKIEKRNAYLVEHYSKSGNKTNWWFCSQEEYEEDKKQKEYYKKCQLLIDDIFSEKIVDNTKNKKLVELHKLGFSYETIHDCIYDIRDKIENALVLKRMEFDGKNAMFLKLSYTFGIIKKEIHNYNKVNEKKIKKEMSVEEMNRNKSIRREEKTKRSIMDIIRERGK